MTNQYEAKQSARRERLEARAERLRHEANAPIDQGRKMAEVIPFGQPILVGHHSEKRDRNYRAKIHGKFDRGFKTLKAADEIAARAASVGTGGISSDDPDAVVKLREELADVEQRHAHMKAVNAAHAQFLKDPATLDKTDFSVSTKATIRTYVPAYSWEKHPFAPYQITNNGANVRRIKDRIEHLLRQAKKETTETLDNSGVKVVENVEANRLQLFFPDKPSVEIRTELKSRGFRWSPTEGAWQRHLGNSATWAAQCVLEKLKGDLA